MLITFKGTVAPGMRLDVTIPGDNEEEIVVSLRNKIAKLIPHVPFTNKDDVIRENLDVDNVKDWTNAEFYAQGIKWFNEANKKKKDFAPITVIPTTAKEFIDTLVALKFAFIMPSE